jgi:hypothetical protein
MAETKITTKQAARILAIVGRVDAATPKVKMASLSVLGQDLKSAGLTVDDVRAAMQAASDMGIEAGDEPSLKQMADKESNQVEKEIAAESTTSTKRRPAAKKEAAPAAATTKPNGVAKTTKPAAAKKEAAPKPATTRTPRAKAEPVALSENDVKKLLKQKKEEDPAKWDKVERIVSVTSNGKPERVIIRCKDPKTGEYTKDRREIKVQDLFQVNYTVEDTKRWRMMKRGERRAAAKSPAPAKAAAPAKKTTAQRTRPAAAAK